MTTNGRSEITALRRAPQISDLGRNPATRCPCCSVVVEALPRPMTIEPCRTCKRPLMLVRMIGHAKAYRLVNLIDLIGMLYGIATFLLLTTFMLSEMNAKALAKAVTILLFVIGPLLLVDGVLSVRTDIDRTWNMTRRGLIARITGVGKMTAGVAALLLVAIGIAL